MPKNIQQIIAEYTARIVEIAGWKAVPDPQPWEDAVCYANSLLEIVEELGN